MESRMNWRGGDRLFVDASNCESGSRSLGSEDGFRESGTRDTSWSSEERLLSLLVLLLAKGLSAISPNGWEKEDDGVVKDAASSGGTFGIGNLWKTIYNTQLVT
jgi:hypothetical protein